MIRQDSLFPTEGMTKSDRSLHTPGNFAKKNLLYVQEVGRLQSLKPHKCVREKLDSFLFLIVLDGRGMLEVNGRHYAMKKGSCALVDCMEHYEHISDEEDAWQLAWVHFNGNVARGYYDLFYKANESNLFEVDVVDDWNELIGNLLEKQKDKGFLAELECGEMLIHLVHKIIGSVSVSDVLTDESQRELANTIREYLNDQYADKNVLNDMKDHFDSDMEDLKKIFRHCFGIRIEEYINNRRLNAAKEMLRFSIKPIEEVAAECGIGDVIFLQQMFDANEGMSAEEYRMKWAQWVK